MASPTGQRSSGDSLVFGVTRTGADSVHYRDPLEQEDETPTGYETQDVGIQHVRSTSNARERAREGVASLSTPIDSNDYTLNKPGRASLSSATRTHERDSKTQEPTAAAGRNIGAGRNISTRGAGNVKEVVIDENSPESERPGKTPE